LHIGSSLRPRRNRADAPPVLRQRKEIKDLQRAGIPTKAAEELLERMQAKVDGLCAERDRQRKEQRIKYPGTNKAINGPIERRFR
jgi:hypothetical protein